MLLGLLVGACSDGATPAPGPEFSPLRAEPDAIRSGQAALAPSTTTGAMGTVSPVLDWPNRTKAASTSDWPTAWGDHTIAAAPGATAIPLPRS